MMRNYDPSLQRLLPATNRDSEVMLNAAFSDWTEHIEENLRDRELYEADSCYTFGEARELFEACKEHAADNQTIVKGNNTVMLVHPFYLHLSEMQLLETREKKDEADQYLMRLWDFIYFNKERQGVEFVVLETLHHYAAATSLLLERELIDRVIFTTHDMGFPTSRPSLDYYGGDQVYFGGGYNGLCLEQGIESMISRSESFEKVWAIYDLILESPGKKTLTPLEIKNIRGEQALILSQATERLGLAA